MKFLLSSICAGSLLLSAQAGEYALHTFKKIVLNELFYSEGANIGDFNKDGKMDVCAGPFWYEGPEYTTKHEVYPPKPYDKNAYSDNFFSFTYDFNGDGWTDILVYGFPGKDASWFENPQGKDGHWVRHKIFDVVDNESPQFEDITGDGKPEILCTTDGFMGYAEADWSDATKPWTFHKITAKGGWAKFTHGLGIGDVNGDGLKDLLDANGWWEHPKEVKPDELWKHYDVKFGNGGAQMHVYDVDGDGKNDVVTSLQAHGWGLAWFKQNADGTFTQNLIMGSKPEENAYGIKFSQMHAVDMVDIDGDGVKDIVTGKRHWAHGNHGDPEPTNDPVLFWFRTVRGEGGKVTFVPYQIDNDSGVGTQVVTGDMNGDGLPDVVVGNKRGVFVFIHQKTAATKEQWDAAQPKPVAEAK
jgi:hypothetical protein